MEWMRFSFSLLLPGHSHRPQESMKVQKETTFVGETAQCDAVEFYLERINRLVLYVWNSLYLRVVTIKKELHLTRLFPHRRLPHLSIVDSNKKIKTQRALNKHIQTYTWAFKRTRERNRGNTTPVNKNTLISEQGSHKKSFTFFSDAAPPPSPTTIWAPCAAASLSRP